MLLNKYNIKHELPEMNELIPGSKYFKNFEALYLEKWKTYSSPPTKAILDNISKAAQALDRIREHFGKPILIHSWYRPEQYNREIGGATNSMHKFGLAVDFSINGFTSDQVREEIIKNNLWPGRWENGTQGWVHVDLKPMSKGGFNP